MIKCFHNCSLNVRYADKMLTSIDYYRYSEWNIVGFLSECEETVQ